MERAPRACNSCRDLKRRCTKELPQCGLCARVGRQCQYDIDNGEGSTESTSKEDLRQRIVQLERRLAEVDPQWDRATSTSTSSGSVIGFNAPLNGHVNGDRAPEINSSPSSFLIPLLSIIASFVYRHGKSHSPICQIIFMGRESLPGGQCNWTKTFRSST